MPKSGKSTASKGRKTVEDKIKKEELTNNKLSIKASKETSSFKVLSTSFRVLFSEWPTTLKLILIYAVISLLFSGGVLSASAVKQLVTNSGNHGFFSSGVSVFSNLISSSLTSSTTGGGIQTVLFVVFSIVIIWYLRKIYSGKTPTVRDTLYKSPYSLIPFFIVFVLLIVELIPLFIGSYLYNVIFNDAIAVGAFEKTIWGIVILILVLISLYLALSSIFSIYIVTLPDMRPFQAIRSSWGLVKKRRWFVFRKVLFILFFLLVAAGFISIVFINVIPFISGWVFLFVTITSVAIGHSYMYSLYRKLI
jgi:hypothetical protein